MTSATFNIISIVIAVALSAFVVWCYIWRAKEDAKDPYGDWLREVKRLNPDYEPLGMKDPQGRYVRNPRWREGQIIRHEDETETHL